MDGVEHNMQLRCIHTPSSHPPSKICIDTCPSRISLAPAFCILIIYYHPPPFPPPPRTINPRHRRIRPAVHLPYVSCISLPPLAFQLMHLPCTSLSLCNSDFALLLSPPRAHPSKFCFKSHSPIITLFNRLQVATCYIVLPPYLSCSSLPSDTSTCSCHCQAWTMSLGSTYSRTFVLVHSSRHSRIDLGSIQCNKYANVIEFNISCVFSFPVCEMLPSLALPMVPTFPSKVSY